MKTRIPFLTFSSIAILIALLALQCKPSDSRRPEDTQATADSIITTPPETETAERLVTPDTMAPPVAPVTTQPEAAIKTVAKPKVETPPKKEDKPTPEPVAKIETKPVPEPAPKAEEPKPAPSPEKKTENEPKPVAPVISNFSVKSAKGSIGGTSNLHDWEMEITKIECKGTFQSVGNEVEAVKNVEVKIPVKNIKSEEGKIMDEKTYKAFESDKNPHIIYTFSSADVKTDGSGAVTIEASGNLSMAGTSKPVSITAKGKVLPNGDLQFSVSKKLNMTEFKMDPPTALMGAIKVGPEVTVKFDLVLVP